MKNLLEKTLNQLFIFFLHIKPKLYKEEIIKLTNQVKDYEERISILEKKVDRFEKNEQIIKQNFEYLFT